jgi:hypothetical protein
MRNRTLPIESCLVYSEVKALSRVPEYEIIASATKEARLLAVADRSHMMQ